MKIKFLIISIFFVSLAFGQEKEQHLSFFQADYFYGNILRHNERVGHFLVNHPTGMLLSWNKKTTGKQDWQHRFNFPDFGVSAAIQDYNNPVLGKLYSLYGHYNFYLLPRKNKNQLVFRVGWGIAYNTNPYDKVTNPKNVAFATKLNSSTYLRAYYQRENIIKNIGLNAGFTVIHASNSSVKSPNTGVNVFAATIGLNYNFNDGEEINYIIPEKEEKKFKEPIKLNVVFRFGANETDFIDSGIKPFFVLSAYADKRLNRKSALQFGGEFHLTYSLKDYIKLTAIVDDRFEKGDFKRASIFVGHELFISKISIITQLGYYVYYPFVFEGRIYERLGLKYYLNDKWFASVSLKAHAAKAETVAFGIGIRL